MADTIIITKDGLKIREWNSDIREYEVFPANPLKVWTYLRSTLEIEDGVTLGDVLSFVEANDMLKMFLQQYSWCKDIDAFHLEARKPPPDKASNIRAIQVGWYQGLPDEWKESVCYSSNVCGLAKEPEPSPWDDGSTTYLPSYALDLTPINELVHLPIGIDTSLVYTSKEVGDEIKTVLETKKEFTFLEFLDALYWEISFYGSPAKREEHSEYLMSAAAEIKAGTAELSDVDID